MANYVFPKLPNEFLVGDTITFSYTGNVQEMDVSKFANAYLVRVDCYGAASVDSGGGQAYGDLNILDVRAKVSKLYFVVGQYNPTGNASWEQVSFGGGGACDGGRGNAGGASDIRTMYNPKSAASVSPMRPYKIDKGTLDEASLKTRIIVGGGAGAADTNGNHQNGGGAGGGWNGDSVWNAAGGTQTGSGGGDGPDGGGKLGCGGTAWNASGAGGGGFYGGAGVDGGGGGSSYVSGNENCPYKTPSGIVFTNSGTNRGVNAKSHGKIILTVKRLMATKSLYYQKPGQSAVKVSMSSAKDSHALRAGVVKLNTSVNGFLGGTTNIYDMYIHKSTMSDHRIEAAYGTDIWPTIHEETVQTDTPGEIHITAEFDCSVSCSAQYKYGQQFDIPQPIAQLYLYKNDTLLTSKSQTDFSGKTSRFKMEYKTNASSGDKIRITLHMSYWLYICVTTRNGMLSYEYNKKIIPAGVKFETKEKTYNTYKDPAECYKP